MYVVLDSSVITNVDWQLSGPAAAVLLAASASGGTHLALPEIVIREVANSHRERERDTIQKLENTRRNLRQLQGAFSSDDRVPVNAINDAWETDFRERLRRALVEVTPVDVVTHDELVARALARRRPFDGEGKDGYRDALIWHAILALAAKDEVAFVANDGHFSGPDGSLHEHLADDLEARGLPRNRVRLFKRTEDAVRQLFEPAAELVTALNERLAADDLFREQVLSRLVEARHSGSLIPAQVTVQLDSDAEQYERWVVDEELDDLVELRNLRVDRAYPSSHDEYSVVLSVDAEALFRVEISTDAWRAQSPLADFELSRDERSFYASGGASVTLEFWSPYSNAEATFGEPELAAMYDV